MSKIIVVTFTNAVDNYGQVLQYYATQEYLRKRGHDVFVHMDEPYHPCLLKLIASRLKNRMLQYFQTSRSTTVLKEDVVNPDEAAKAQVFKQWNDSIQRNEQQHPRKFQEFKNKNFNILRCPSFQLSKQKADVCVVGSDQMWSWVSDYNFLAWATKNAKRISIAPSVGHKQFSDAEIERAKPLLKQFDFITVREDNGLDFCKKAGREDAVKILDPSFLLSEQDYAIIEKKIDQKKPYLLLYLLGGDISVDVSEIYQFAKTEGLEVVYVASQGREDDYPKCFAEVGEWLSLVRNAIYVFTNSFHGMAFSIIYHKQFLVFPLVGLMKGMNGRIFNLSNLFGLQNCIFTNSFEGVKNNTEWNFIDTIIEYNKAILSRQMSSIGL